VEESWRKFGPMVATRMAIITIRRGKITLAWDSMVESGRRYSWRQTSGSRRQFPSTISVSVRIWLLSNAAVLWRFCRCVEVV